MKSKQLFTSNKQDWETPQKLFDELDKEFNFELDAAASATNAKCKNYYSEEQDSLKQDWSLFLSIFVNPPYENKKQNEFIKKAYDTHKKCGNTIVLLIPARTDTKRWHDYIIGKSEIRFLRGRLTFEINGIPYKDPATFPSAVVIYRR